MSARIGITRGEDDVAEYAAAVRRAGGEVVELPAVPSQVLADLERIDGLVLSGGVDLAPSRYSETPHAETQAPDETRDTYELALASAAFERRLPTLAICRGLQVANVSLGGSLAQHVPDIVGEAIPHRYPARGPAERGLLAGHLVNVEPGSRLADVVGTHVRTGSRHHQAAARIATALRVVARTDDGIVEGLEPIDASWFWLAVQWHPESTLDEDAGASLELFRALVSASGEIPLLGIRDEIVGR